MSNKIRVVHHAKTVDYAGTSRVAQLFCKYLLQSDKYEPFLVYREPDNNNRLEIVKEWLGEERVIPYQWKPGNKIKLPPYFPEEDNFAEVLKEIQPDVVHVHYSGYNEFPALKWIYPQAKWIGHNIFAYKEQDPQMDLIIYISNFIRDEALKKGGPNGPVLYNPVEMPKRDVIKENKKICRGALLRRFGMTDDAIILGRVGRPDNFDPISLKAFKEIQKSHDNVYYLVVNPCDGWRTTVKNLHLENIFFLDPIIDDQELSDFYMGIDIYAHSRHDGECCPCNIQEAMMHGIPIVSHYSAIYNGQSEIIEGGGFCVPLGDYLSYFKVLDQLVLRKDVRDHFGREARRTAMKSFEASCIISKLEKIYERLFRN